ncbi:hypothetical protein PENSUB_10054 [Penicillium subrubescens]|uniref:Transcription factor domain-containing protein n=1 Tax=Penicillium subrubescens TaxID=1316194 RepID=A0A1Q5TAN9_9EURO|nr:hypothetical protein PENSUB_10054 [Penicillium subrubescens]
MASNLSCERFVNIPTTTLYQKRVDLLNQLREGPRLRRRHTKSRNGCVTCKQRRIKMELMHHFVTHTATTLVFSSELWRGPLLRLSLHVDYLLNAILMIAATHRSFLADPGQDQYHHAAQKYLAKTLRGYQDALSHPISSTPGDALIAVSLLLYHYAWSDVDHMAGSFTSSQSPKASHELTSRVDFAADPLLNLSVGLRYLFWKTGALAAGSDSPFRPYALERPRTKIVQAVRRQQQEFDILNQMESYLLRGYHSHGVSITGEFDSSALQLSPEGLAGDSVTLAAFSESAGRLAPILAVLSSSVGIEDKPDIENASNHSGFDCGPAVQLRDIIRYLFSYPIHFCDTFRSLVASQDRRALFLLLHFFHAVHRLLPPGLCWWSQRRAMLFEHHFKGIQNMQPAVPDQFVVSMSMSPRLEVNNQWACYRVRDWLDGGINPRKLLSPEQLDGLRELFRAAVGARVLAIGLLVILFESLSGIRDVY